MPKHTVQSSCDVAAHGEYNSGLNNREYLPEVGRRAKACVVGKAFAPTGGAMMQLSDRRDFLKW